MEKWYFAKKYIQWVIINKQIEQLNKRDVFSRNSSLYLPVVSKLQELYSRLQKNIEEVLLVMEEAHEEREEKWEYWMKVNGMQWDLDAAVSLLQWAEQSIEKETNSIKEMWEQKSIYEQNIWIIRDTIREITAKSWYSTDELTTHINEIGKLEKNIASLNKLIWKSTNLITSNNQWKDSLEKDIVIIQEQLIVLKAEKKEFNKDYYAKKILDVFSKWYDSRPQKNITTYSTTEELFGIKPAEVNHNLMKDWERTRSELSTSWSQVDKTYQRLSFNKILWVKNTLDALWVTLDENAIHQFSDVLYIYVKSLDKGIIVSNQKFVVWEKEVYSHATFIIPGAPIFKVEWWISFPSPLFAKRIRFHNEENREKDVLDSLLKDNNDEQFKKVIHTYDEERWTNFKSIWEKAVPIAEQATEKCVVKEIITSYFKNKTDITNQTYLDFASAWNINPDNKYKLKATLLWLKNLLWGNKPIYKSEYIIALLYDERDSIANMEQEYDDNLKTVYNSEKLKEDLYYLVENDILNTDGLWSIKYVKVFVERCAKHICEIKNIDFSKLQQKEKYRLISETYEWITWVPSSLSIALWGVESRDSTYQKLLLEKFIATYENKDEWIIKKIQDKIDQIEPQITEWLWWVEKNVFKEYSISKKCIEKEDKNDVQDQIENKTPIVIKVDEINSASTTLDSDEPKVLVSNHKQKKEITILPSELNDIPTAVNNTISRVVKLMHDAPIPSQLELIKKLFQYWYLYFKKNTSLKKDTEKPYSYFGKFYQQTYLHEICMVATDIQDDFKTKFFISCMDKNIKDSIKRILSIHQITNKRK